MWKPMHPHLSNAEIIIFPHEGDATQLKRRNRIVKNLDMMTTDGDVYVIFKKWTCWIVSCRYLKFSKPLKLPKYGYGMPDVLFRTYET